MLDHVVIALYCIIKSVIVPISSSVWELLTVYVYVYVYVGSQLVWNESMVGCGCTWLPCGQTAQPCDPTGQQGHSLMNMHEVLWICMDPVEHQEVNKWPQQTWRCTLRQVRVWGGVGSRVGWMGGDVSAAAVDVQCSWPGTMCLCMAGSMCMLALSDQLPTRHAGLQGTSVELQGQVDRSRAVRCGYPLSGSLVPAMENCWQVSVGGEGESTTGWMAVSSAATGSVWPGQSAGWRTLLWRTLLRSRHLTICPHWGLQSTVIVWKRWSGDHNVSSHPSCWTHEGWHETLRNIGQCLWLITWLRFCYLSGLNNCWKLVNYETWIENISVIRPENWEVFPVLY